MTEQELEQLIAKHFAALPRKSLVLGDKEKVWQKIQNNLRQIRAQKPAISWGVFGFLRMSKLALTALTVIVAVSLAGGMARASKGSMPGETLYSVKKAVEQVEVVIATAQGGDKKVTTLKTHAQTRLLEVTTLVTENASREVVQEGLDDLKTATDKVMAATEEKPELLNHAVELATEETKTLTEVQNKAEGEVREAVQNAIADTKESFDKIIGQEQIEPDKTQAVQGTQTAATSTAKAAGKVSAPSKPAKTEAPKDGEVQSGIILEIITGGNSTEHDTGPTILPEPNTEF